MKRRLLLLSILVALSSVLASMPALGQMKWDLPAGYPAANPHTQNLTQFAADVEKASGDKLTITVHPNGVVVQGTRDQARRADRPGADRRSVDESARERKSHFRRRRGAVRRNRLRRFMEAVAGATPGSRKDSGRPGHQAALCSRVATARDLHEEAVEHGCGYEGAEMARLQPRDHPHRATGRSAATDDSGGRAVAGACPPAWSIRSCLPALPESTRRFGRI